MTIDKSKLVGYFDNGYTLFINGTMAVTGTTTANAGVNRSLASDLFVVGENIIAVKCDDDAGDSALNASYFDFLLDPVL